MGSHLRAYVCALYARNMSGEPKNKIGGRQYQTKPDQQEFQDKKTLIEAKLQMTCNADSYIYPAPLLKSWSCSFYLFTSVSTIFAHG